MYKKTDPDAYVNGMTKREHFTLKIFCSLISSDPIMFKEEMNLAILQSVKAADLLIEALNRDEGV